MSKVYEMTYQLTLSAEELIELTGFRRPADQLTELLRRGFYRARQSAVTGRVVLERAHYEAVCASTRTGPHPSLRPPRQTRA